MPPENLLLLSYVGFGNNQERGPCAAGASDSDPGWVLQVSSQDQQRVLQGDFRKKIFSYVNAAGHAGTGKIPLVTLKREFWENERKLNKRWLKSKEKRSMARA